MSQYTMGIFSLNKDKSSIILSIFLIKIVSMLQYIIGLLRENKVNITILYWQC